MKAWMELAEAAECGHSGGCGCDAFHGCCTHCPLPDCAFHDPTDHHVGKQPGKVLRNLQMCELREEGVSVSDIAARFKTSVRNTFRVLSAG